MNRALNTGGSRPGYMIAVAPCQILHVLYEYGNISGEEIECDSPSAMMQFCNDTSTEDMGSLSIL